MTFCGSNYANNEFSRYECFQRCDEESCGKGGTCSPEGRCDCHLGYRIDITNPRICLEISETNTITLNKTSQCTDCSDSINKTVNSQIKQNSPVNVTANSDSNQNTTLGEDMISQSTYRAYIAVLSCFALILLMGTIALMVMFIKVKHELPQNEGKLKILFGEFY
ncbi:hypothetical protein QE152_g13165 [Popillia japonica]|uniref:EGF-like domain-containing protein n=1 Tax=Popillia japonica TaxID=7064 RepID=A0AAW1LAW7_POPJA